MINWDMEEAPKREYDELFNEALSHAIAYLQATDWQVIAKYERKRPIPEEVKQKRKEALDIVTAE